MACELCLIPQPFHLGQHAGTTFGRFFDDTFAFFPGAVLLNELVGRKSDKFLGHLVEEEGMTYVADAHGIIDPDNLLAPLQAASCTYRIAFGPRAGHKVLSLQYAASRAAPMTQPLCATAHGFSLHAGVRCAAEQRSEL